MCSTLPFDLPSHSDSGKLELRFNTLSPLVTTGVVSEPLPPTGAGGGVGGRVGDGLGAGVGAGNWSLAMQ
jgi:hypothetical protein